MLVYTIIIDAKCQNCYGFLQNQGEFIEQTEP